MTGRPLTLSTVEFDVVWRALDLDAPPPVLRVPSPGRTDAERAEIEARAWTALHTRGLSEQDGDPVSLLARRLATLAHPTVAIELRGWDGGSVNAMIGRAARRAALAVVRSGQVEVSAVPETGLARSIVKLLPARPAGPGHSVTITTAAYADAIRVARGGPALRNALVSKGLRTADARTLVEMATGGNSYWQFAATVRGHRSMRVVTVRGDDRRGYVLTRRITPGSDHLTLAPAATAKILATVEELVTSTHDS